MKQRVCAKCEKPVGTLRVTVTTVYDYGSSDVTKYRSDYCGYVCAVRALSPSGNG